MLTFALPQRWFPVLGVWFCVLGAWVCPALQAQAPWSPAAVTIQTPWAEDVGPGRAWPEYPRPQMVRKDWTNLNGLWDYAVTTLGRELPPQQWDGKILVPYALESSLSGVGKRLENNQALWYQRTFELGEMTGRLLLNFEAVDHTCIVWVNGERVGERVGENAGGNLPFSFDITDAIKPGQNTLTLRVEDFTDDRGKYQLRGKQQRDARGIWYTPVSGIWQTVWLEPVPEAYIASLKIDTQIDPAVVSVQAHATGRDIAGQSVRVTVKDGDEKVARATGRGAVMLPVPDAELWSPASPKLYGLTVELLDAQGRVVDSVESYTGIREIGEKVGEHGKLVFTLNGEEIFHWGPLDQGWWPESLLTPPTDEAMRFDIDYLKAAGFNMIRNHIKVRPRRYYAYCDQVGMMVWQDHVSGGAGGRGPDREWPAWTRLNAEIAPDADWPDWAHEQFMAELKTMVDTLYNHPSIVSWVPFNEAWGQHRTMQVGRWITDYDPTRHINIASGGNFWPVGDVVDAHKYPHPEFPWDDARFMPYIHVVGEFGGHGFPVPGHRWKEDGRNWGYGGLPKDEAEYRERFAESLRLLKALKDRGIAGAVYTQTSDVEIEINGLLTYDRKVIKIPAEDIAPMSAELLAD